ncbi:MAG TPA: ABC transporter ATP-binding protein [Dehalococcoidia bacterium]|nr:ABC transporter ATP-binding protein [Dehalococcoidia bacterium]
MEWKREELRVEKEIGEPILVVENAMKAFGGLQALNNISFEVRRGEILSIIGPNGAGKSVMLNCINGLPGYRLDSGRIVFDGQDITNWPPHKRAHIGISRTFQKIELFGGMTVLDNVKLGRHMKMNTGWWDGGIYWGKAVKEEAKHRKWIEEKVFETCEIEIYRNRITGMLPYGVQKRIELARALAMGPRLLLLDEPMAGLNLEEVEDMTRFILDANEEKEWNCTIILVEHDMGVVMDISDRVIVFDWGAKIADGPPEEVQNKPEVIRAYLGEVEETYITRR